MEGGTDSLVMVHDLDFEVDSAVNIEVDLTDTEARQVLAVMSRYGIPTYSEAVHWLAMCGLGLGLLDPSGAQMRATLRGLVFLFGLLTGAALDHEGVI